jgi:CHASE3 domain sensor protein
MSGTGYLQSMRTDDDTRSLEQEVAAGESETTPVAVITTVVGVVAVIFLVALTLTVVAYVLA